MNPDRGLASANGKAAVRGVRELVADPRVQIVGKDDFTGGGLRLHPSRGVDRVTDGREVHHPISADIADKGNTGVDSRANRQDTFAGDGRDELYGSEGGFMPVARASDTG
jgi:hypothetical protein